MRRDFAGSAVEPGPDRLRAAIDDWLQHRLSGEPQLLTDSRAAYLEHHLARSLAAIALVPEQSTRGRLLELGSGLYLMTFLVERLRNYELDLVQYWGRPSGCYASTLTDQRTGAVRRMPFREFNGEKERFPFPDETFDVILNCDTIEHMLCDPVHLLAECHRVLKPGGVMVVTTPNVLRLDNVARLLRGDNILDKYVLQSASARHPREYTPHELKRIHEWVGFDVPHLETRDVTKSNLSRSARRLTRAALKCFDLGKRYVGQGDGAASEWRGEQILMTARRARPVRTSAPDFLYEAPASGDALIDALYGDVGVVA